MPVKNLGDLAGVTGRAVVEVIASANVIGPKTDLVRLTGNTVVKTITRPNYSSGPIRIFNTDAAPGTWDATGNIVIAGTFTRYLTFEFMYDPTTSKWYPNKVV